VNATFGDDGRGAWAGAGVVCAVEIPCAFEKHLEQGQMTAAAAEGGGEKGGK
jgi:hypothetical protein